MELYYFLWVTMPSTKKKEFYCYENKQIMGEGEDK